MPFAVRHEEGASCSSTGLRAAFGGRLHPWWQAQQIGSAMGGKHSGPPSKVNGRQCQQGTLSSMSIILTERTHSLTCGQSPAAQARRQSTRDVVARSIMSTTSRGRRMSIRGCPTKRWSSRPAPSQQDRRSGVKQVSESSRFAAAVTHWHRTLGRC
jgi:hypothetical protein